MSGVFTIGSSTPTLRRNLNEHSLQLFLNLLTNWSNFLSTKMLHYDREYLWYFIIKKSNVAFDI
jgi:hypothetical protein